MLNILWLWFFIIGLLSGAYQFLVLQHTDVFAAMVRSLFDMAELSVQVVLVLFGTLTLWMGFLRIAEKAGLIELLAKLLSPILGRLMPGVPHGHPAFGLITLNFAANGLGLDNAATPIGLRAMHSLQSLNTDHKTATNAQILFLVLNSSSLTLLPVTIFMYRAQQGAADPTLVFLPILLATFCSSMVGLITVAVVQRLPLWRPFLLLTLGGLIALFALFVAVLSTLSASALNFVSSLMGNLSLLLIIVGFLLYAALKKVTVYDAFIDGAKGGFAVGKELLPYLVAMLCAIGFLRSSGALDLALSGVQWLFELAHLDTRFIEGLPTALAKPFSGSAARALMIETMQHHGVDSFPALVAATVQGSTETTFYVLAVYFGAVGIQRTRHALPCALIADLSGIIAAISICYWFFG
ncbi:MAG TPA: nucleoside recognition domain-containing protein [Paenalcaligenes sp.]|nr:nucleoside recognition domain-containing protein [Paenalcaligenes sp.]